MDQISVVPYTSNSYFVKQISSLSRKYYVKDFAAKFYVQ